MKDEKSKRMAVLIHGLAAHRALMLPLSWRLQKCGFEVRRFGYRSLFGSIEDHAVRFRKLLDELDAENNVSELFLVSHSMGGIVARQALLESYPKKLRRWVMLTPPNHGSPVATFLASRVLPFCRTLGQLTDSENSFVRNLPEPPLGVEIGIIAASHDRVIPDGNARLTNATAELTLSSGHNGVLVRPNVARQVIQFLEFGHFVRTGPEVSRLPQFSESKGELRVDTADCDPSIGS